jgi:hypothetical protein
MADEAVDYRSYLLRLWRVREGERDVWRASLQDPQSGERISFSTLDALFAFLQEQLESGLGTGCDRTHVIGQRPHRD